MNPHKIQFFIFFLNSKRLLNKLYLRAKINKIKKEFQILKSSFILIFQSE